MRAVLQRVNWASVEVNGEIKGSISKGWLVLLGVKNTDTERDIDYIAEKTLNLRLFPDSQDKFNLSLIDISGEILVVSQFTVYADCRKGRRPSFIDAAPLEKANSMYEEFIKKLKMSNLKVESGVFQAMMSVKLENAGPVTIVLDSEKGI